MKNSCGVSKRELSEVMLMLYPVMIPFLSDMAGRSQTRVKLLERTSPVVKLSGGPFGTVQRKTLVLNFAESLSLPSSNVTTVLDAVYGPSPIVIAVTIQL